MSNAVNKAVNGTATVTAAAQNLAAWHTSSVRALGLACRTEEHWWTCSLPGPGIFHSAIALTPQRGSGRLAIRRHLHELRVALVRTENGYRSVCDSWNELDLTRLDLSRRNVGPWFARPAGPLDHVDVDEPLAEPLEIDEARDRAALLQFEQTMTQAFRVPVLIPPFGVHAPPILEDPDMHVLVGRSGGRPVSVAMAYRAHGVLGVYGVGTVPEARRAGHATAMMRRVLAIAPELPTTLQPSPMAESMYRAMGFERVGTFAHWV